MAVTLDPTTPADAYSPRQGAAKIRALTLQLLSLLTHGGGAAVTFANAPWSVDSSGNVTIPTTLSVPAPTAIAHATSKTYVDQLGPWSATSADGPNTYTATLVDPNGVAPLALAQLVGLAIAVKFTNGNTGASTLNVNGFGAKAIQTSGVAITSGQLQAGLYAILVYDGTQFELLSDGIPVVNTGITLATKGSITLQGGLIIKWNALPASGVASASDTFTTAFPNNAFIAVASGSIIAGSNSIPAVNALSTTSVTFTSITTFPASDIIYYVVIGN